MSEPTLLDLFAEVLPSLPKQVADRRDVDSGITFTGDTLPVVPEELSDDHIELIYRQRYTSYGLIDNVIISLDRLHSSALGLWILACTLQSNKSRYILTLKNANSQLTKIRLEPKHSDGYGLRVKPEQFIWEPSGMESLLANAHSDDYLKQQSHIIVTNESGKWYSSEEYAKRDILAGFGPPGGACLIAEFFLEFGLVSCNVNYEYIKYQFGGNLADEFSCELRAEFSEAVPEGWRTTERNKH